MEFSSDSRGSESLRSKHLLTLGWFSWVFRSIVVDPPKTKLVANSGGGGFVAFSGILVPSSKRKHAQAHCLGKH